MSQPSSRARDLALNYLTRSKAHRTAVVLIKVSRVFDCQRHSLTNIKIFQRHHTDRLERVWMQAVAYANLAFNVLAAFGAVLGKQWLNACKATRGEERVKFAPGSGARLREHFHCTVRKQGRC
jgi:hypothetical protein